MQARWKAVISTSGANRLHSDLSNRTLTVFAFGSHRVLCTTKTKGNVYQNLLVEPMRATGRDE